MAVEGISVIPAWRYSRVVARIKFRGEDEIERIFRTFEAVEAYLVIQSRVGRQWSTCERRRRYVDPWCDRCRHRIHYEHGLPRWMQAGDEILCTACITDDAIAARREVNEVLTDFMQSYRDYDAAFMNVVGPLYKKACAAPRVPGIYALIRTSDSTHPTFYTYVGCSTSSVRSRLLDHADAFARMFIGNPPSCASARYEILARAMKLGLRVDRYRNGNPRMLERDLRVVFSSSDFDNLSKHGAIERLCDEHETRPEPKATTRLVKDAVANGASYDLEVLATFPNANREAMRTAYYSAKRERGEDGWRHPDEVEILMAEAYWQQFYAGSSSVVPLWTADTSHRLAGAKPASRSRGFGQVELSAMLGREVSAADFERVRTVKQHLKTGKAGAAAWRAAAELVYRE